MNIVGINDNSDDLSKITIIKIFNSAYTKAEFDNFINTFGEKSKILQITNTQFLNSNVLDTKVDSYKNNFLGTLSLEGFSESVIYTLIALIEFDGIQNYSLEVVRNFLYQENTIFCIHNIRTEYKEKLIKALNMGKNKAYTLKKL